MKKIFLKLLLALCCTFLFTALIGCESNQTQSANQEFSQSTSNETLETIQDGISFKTLTIDGTNVYGKVSNATTMFSFLNEVSVSGKTKYIVSLDIYGIQQVATKTIPLTIGDNILYLVETVDGEPKNIYTVTIRRRPFYTVTFDGYDVNPQQVEEDNFATVPTQLLTKTGYTFTGWDFDFSTPIAKNTTISPKWTANPDTPYKVEYYLQNILYETLSLTGTTDSTVNAEIKTYSGFAPTKQIVTGEIKSDGSTVLKVYYTRISYKLGDTVQDFEIVTSDNETYKLSTVLQDKKIVLLKFWASWCGPCESEFPAMQNAFVQAQDYVSVLAVSTTDTQQTVRDYKSNKGLTFPMASDSMFNMPDGTPASLVSLFGISAVPVSIVINDCREIVYWHFGSITSTSEFLEIFAEFVGEEVYGDGMTYEKAIEICEGVNEIDCFISMTPIGIKHKFTPTKSGVYRFHSVVSKEYENTAAHYNPVAWIVDSDKETILSYCDNTLLLYNENRTQLDNQFSIENFDIYVYMEKDVTYYALFAFFLNATGKFPMHIDYVGEAHTYLTNCCVEPFSFYIETNEFYQPGIVPYALGDDGYYYVVDKNGNQTSKIYLDMVHATSLFPNDSLKNVINTADKYAVTKRLFYLDGVDYTSVMSDYLWNAEMNNNELNGLVAVDEQLMEILIKLMKKSDGFGGVENSWQRMCYYYKTITKNSN